MTETVYQLTDDEMDALCEAKDALANTVPFYDATEVAIEFRYPEKRVRVVVTNDQENGEHEYRYEVGY